MRILLTGSNGFIGSHIKKALKGKYELLIPHAKDLNEVIKKGEFDFIIHCAWAGKYGDTSILDLILNLTLMNKLLRTKKPMIYFSSGIVYNKQTDFYSLGKRAFHNLKKPNVLNLTLFVVYGKGEDPNRIIPKTIRQSQITIDQDQFFDAIHVSDVVSAVRYFIENKWRRTQYDLVAPPAHLLSDIPVILKKNFKVNGIELKPSYIGNASDIIMNTPLTFLTLEEGLKHYEQIS